MLAAFFFFLMNSEVVGAVDLQGEKVRQKAHGRVEAENEAQAGHQDGRGLQEALRARAEVPLLSLRHMQAHARLNQWKRENWETQSTLVWLSHGSFHCLGLDANDAKVLQRSDQTN